MIKKPRGTRDYFGEDIKLFNQIKNVVTTVAKTYNVDEIKIPMFEELELFKRGTGETTDIVTKEIYQFTDKGGRNLALRPEGTAGVMRSYIENKFYGDFSKTTKQFYLGEFFRYERPQNGRQRQFNQFGVEYINIESNLAVVEVFLQILQILTKLGIENINFTLNNLGTPKQREEYKKSLVKYLLNYKDNLCSDCLNRLNSNPLRILDCKIDGEKDFVINAPKIKDFYSNETKEEYNEFLQLLDNLKIEYKIDYTMVRGLDYYSNIIFEVNSSNNTLLGGGCYNSLFEQLGGKKQVKAIGYGLGIERLMNYLKELNLEKIPNDLKVFILNKTSTPSSNTYLLDVCNKLREQDIICEYDLLNKSQKSLFKFTNTYDGIVAIIEDSDILNNEITIFENKKKIKTSIEKLIRKVKNV